MTPERHIPDWARRERQRDLEWIGENLHVFWPVAQIALEEQGRGAIVVDTTSRPTGKGHPFGYLTQETIEKGGDEDTQRMVQEYNPEEEFVIVLLKSKERASTYRIKPQPKIDTKDVIKLPEDLEQQITDLFDQIEKRKGKGRD